MIIAERNDNMTLGEKIYRLRTQKGLSQETFGEMLGVSRQSVSKWETNQSVPELEKVIAISELFDVTTDYLLKDRDDRTDRTKTSVEEADKSMADTLASSYMINTARPRYNHYEYKSQKTIKGLPLVHINLGMGLYRAKGIIAIGNLAAGVVALGFLSAGAVSAGLLSAGVLLAVGTIAAGFISMGSFAVGCIAFGAISIGIFCMGALNIGEFGVGALSYGKQVAIGDEAHGRIALGFSRAAGELYEEVNKAGKFDYPTIEKIIDENVSPYWFPFRAWIKGIIRMMGKQ
ncbi:MAG: helix-turn-helix domain-containing protein [Bacillus sp. (in: Bacteria)]|nr:helix-turn-helix domain-containing protein [Bacillus sp. (in: firmicutes)]MCM1426634.1 helix-turn-helix domain-containing protein [Eubacterium sp.]